VLWPGQFFWRALPLMPYVQFSWRWLAALAVPLSIAAAPAVHQAPAMLRPRLVIVGVLAAVWLAHTSTYPANGYAVARADQAAIESGRGYVATKEYGPPNRDILTSPTDPVILAGPGKIWVMRWDDEFKRVRIAADANMSARFRVTYFPAWRATLNGREAPVLEDHATGLAQVSVPAGDSDVELRFTRTRDRTLGWAISWVALAGVIAGWLRRKVPSSS
jgi:hypothetical protein